jgi:hypothetical protein
LSSSHSDSEKFEKFESHNFFRDFRKMFFCVFFDVKYGCPEGGKGAFATPEFMLPPPLENSY